MVIQLFFSLLSIQPNQFLFLIKCISHAVLEVTDQGGLGYLMVNDKAN